jgi:hypothetical protein
MMKIGLLISFLFLVGCQVPGIILKETPLSISETRKAIVIVAGEPRTISSNGRELYSKFYDRDGRSILKMDGVQERFYSLFIVLGDRRPYDISVQVIRELRNVEGQFQKIGTDDGRANEIATRLKKTLIESRDNRNVLDDFRSF